MRGKAHCEHANRQCDNFTSGIRNPPLSGSLISMVNMCVQMLARIFCETRLAIQWT